MTGGTKGGAQRASGLRPRCVGEVDLETATHIYLDQTLSEAHPYQPLSTLGFTSPSSKQSVSPHFPDTQSQSSLQPGLP
jgi:hypothetical protein